MTPKKLKAIEMLALGVYSYTEIAEECNITQVTLRRWRKDPEFSKAVLEESRRLLKDKLPGIYNVLTDNALSGSHQHIKLLLDHLDRLEELKQVAEQGSISFTWKQTPTPPSEQWETDQDA